MNQRTNKPLPEPWRLTPEGERVVTERGSQLRDLLAAKRAARKQPPKDPK